jgi:hypothetical protein
VHESQLVLDRIGISTRGTHPPLTSVDAARLKLALVNDAANYLRHAAVALSEGIAGIELALSTWATVQLYYSAFYSARTLLAVDDTCLFYCGRSPRVIIARAGERPTKAHGSTHIATLQAYSRTNPNSIFLSQQIEQMDPLTWLISKREAANYRNPAPFEPALCQDFISIRKMGVRKALVEYLSDTTFLYTFDKDHALLAFPLRFFEAAQNALRIRLPQNFDDEFVRSLRPLLKDPSGPFPTMAQLLSE